LGMFKKMNEAMQQNAEMIRQNQGSWAEQQAMADRLNNPQGPPLTGDEPTMQPVEGISLQRYAELAVGMQHLGADVAAQTAYAEQNGVPEGRYMPIAEEWARRMQADPRINKRFNELWREANARR
jgi:hypothetical protein